MFNRETGLIDARIIKADFPILQQEIRPGIPLVYLDSAATAQKPNSVIQTVNHYYQSDNANIHRGIHALAERATEAYENARAKIARFIGAGSAKELIFVRNTTEGINLVAQTWGRINIGPGDEILLTELEHHSNIVPWQLLAQEKHAKVRYIPVDGDCCLDLSTMDDLITSKTRMVAFSGMSNVLGSMTPVKTIVQKAHEVGAIVLLDGAQLVPHAPVNVIDLDLDFMSFSGHKMCGPTGIGALYGKRTLLEQMPPFLGGGDMIRRVTFEGAEWNDLPWKFEAGTPSIAQAIGMGAAVDYLDSIGMERIEAYEHALADYALEALSEIPGLDLLGPSAAERGATIAFTQKGIHPHDIAEILNHDGIAIRAGHHCAMPLHGKLGLAATSRASMYIYNTFEDVDLLVLGLYKAQKLFGLN